MLSKPPPLLTARRYPSDDPAGYGHAISAYRHASGSPKQLTGEAGDADAIRAAMKAIIATRSDSQPQGVRTGGSTFANPDGRKSWQLIDQAGAAGFLMVAP